MLMSKWHLFFPSPIFKYFFSKYLMYITLEFEGDQSFLFTNLSLNHHHMEMKKQL